MDALVLGCGIVGLTSAIALQEAGLAVGIWARDQGVATTSSVAAALWYPYRAYPEDQVLAWGSTAYQTFRAHAGVADAGVRLCAGVELLRGPVDDPWWRGAVEAFEPIGGDTLPPGYTAGWRFTAPVIAMPAYLDWLGDRFASAGGTVSRREVANFDEALETAPTVVNCTGLGARSLAGDPAVSPVRGQIVRIANPGLRDFVLDQTGEVTYVIPRGDDCILGGTAEEGAWDVVPDPVTAAAILERCRALVPAVGQAEVLEHRAGLRPMRPAVRLECDAAGVVHNYGHGGAGVTLSWGCARDVVRLVTGA